jgi:hypothetical protein
VFTFWSYVWQLDPGHTYDEHLVLILKPSVTLWSYAWLLSEGMTPVVYPDSGRPSWFWSTSRLWSYPLASVTHHSSGRWACCMSYHLSCEGLHMAELDDCSILQPGHLVKSKLGGTHDLFIIRNLSISRLCMFKCQAMCRATNDT